MKEDPARLPKWAQEKLKRLEERVVYLETKVDAGVVGPTFPFQNLFLEGEGTRPEFQPSRFRGGRLMIGPDWRDFIDFRREGPNKVYVHSGLSFLRVRPAAGNAIILSAAHTE